ncbi:MAG: L-rhamnose/proton symporter RhaT [Bacteroidota bacterium]
MSVLAGIFFHFIGSSAASSFYLPFKKVKGWSWESYWLIGGIASWIIMPLIMGWIFVPDLFGIISKAPQKAVYYTFFFGLLWGIGGLTFGLSMRYLGLSLGYAIVLGFTTAFGTIIPPIFDGSFGALIAETSGKLILLGLLLSLTGIFFCGLAGFNKERELVPADPADTIKEFDLRKGVVIALISGVLSACMAFGLVSGKPIAKLAVEHGTPNLWQNNVVLVVILWGGFITNFIWCLILNTRNSTYKDYLDNSSGRIGFNYLFSSLAGSIWYLQFFFYGMGSTQMGKYDFISWTLHMTMIIILSTIWGVVLGEWKSTSSKTKRLLSIGLFLLISSILAIGLGGAS